MEWIVFRLKDKSLRFLLYLLLLEIVLLVFQYALAGEYRRESLRIIEAKGKISRATSWNSYRRDYLPRYEAGLAELESILPGSVENEAAAVELVAARLRDHGIAAVAETTVRKEKEIGVVARGDSTYTDMLSFFAGLRQDAPAAAVRELSVRALDGERVSFSAEIIFFWTGQGEKGSIGVNNEEQEK